VNTIISWINLEVKGQFEGQYVRSWIGSDEPFVSAGRQADTQHLFSQNVFPEEPND
jgi:hypothetical protein